ncbi:hypothetical protein PIB30_095282 [Stylosanthes scabra]|uniref:Uncharacterized protein n=1 Tax=Stylosanthes scabra TaxID=79078 RepID=A0ABU6RW02_9FABA|nr:hypothetical protein [Stylosanthes scabra]
MGTTRGRDFGSLHTGAPPRTRPLETGWYTVELGRTPTHSEVFERTHTRKEDQLWVDKRSADVNHPPLFPDDEDADTASAPDVRERVVMLNREISQQAEANARRVVALDSTVQTQSQEVSDLRKAYADMYILLTQMRSGGSSSAPLPDLPPPPPPPPPPQTDAPGTGSPDADDDPDYV